MSSASQSPRWRLSFSSFMVLSDFVALLLLRALASATCSVNGHSRGRASHHPLLLLEAILAIVCRLSWYWLNIRSS